MSSTPVANEAESRAFSELVTTWAQDLVDQGFAASFESGTSDDGKLQWIVRFAGEEKQIIALWFTLRQRTVYVESELIPAPQENVEEVFAIALAKNYDLFPLHLASGSDGGLYLVTRFPVGDATTELLDELGGATIRSVEELFPTLIARGFASVYRRRPRLSTR